MIRCARTNSAGPSPRASYRAATALRWSLVPRNVADAVDAPRVRRAERPVLSEGQVGHLLDALRDDRLYSLYFLALDTGLREGE